MEDLRALKEDELVVRNDIITSLNKSYFIEAGAGAGKTTTIVNRVINQLTDPKNPLNPREIAIITYTNAAAEELRTRLSTAVSGKSEILKDFPGMKISTIHSFCMDILQNYSFEAKIPLDFALITDEDEDKLIKDIFNKWSTETKELDYSKFEDLPDDVNPKDIIFKLYFELCKTGDETKAGFSKVRFDKNVVLETISRAEKVLNKFYKIENDCLSNNVFTNKAKYSSVNDIMNTNARFVVTSLRDYVDEAKVIDYNQSNWKKNILTYLKKLLPTKDSENYEKGNDFFKKGKACVQDMTGEMNNKMKPILENNYDLPLLKKFINAIIYQQLWDYSFKAYQYYLENRPKNVVTNNSILLLTNNLLGKTYNKIREDLQNKFKCLYVDEYQDTSYLQDEIVWKICTDDKGNLIPGSLVIVGDPKQSIYKFTGADVSVFLERKEKFKEEKAKNSSCCDVINLDFNFRSNDRIINYVNKVYKSKMPKIYSEMHWDPPHTVPNGKDDDYIAGFYHYDFDYSGIDKDKRTSRDAQEVCKIIKYLLTQKIYADTGKKDENNQKIFKERFIKYSDIMVITDTTTNYDIFINELKTANIPFNLDGKFKQSGEFVVNAFRRLFRCLVDYKDKAALFGTVEMLKLTNIPKPKKPKDINEINAHYEKFINSLREQTKNFPCHAIAQFLLEHIEILYPEDTDMTYVEVLSAQKKIQQMVENAISGNYKNGVEYANYFDDYSSSDVKFELALGGDNNVIRLMNFHKSKGLEASIVIFAKRDYDRAFKYDSYRDKNLFYPGIKNAWCSYCFDEPLKDKIVRENEEEMVRYEYVIATRAKEAVIFLNPFDSSKKTLFSLSASEENPVNLDKEYGNELLKPFEIKPSFDEKSSAKLTDVKHKEKKKADTTELKKNAYSHINPSKAEEKEKGYGILRPLREKAKTDEVLKLNDRPVGNVAGNCLHRTMELFVNSGRDVSKVDRIIKQTLYENSNDFEESEYDKYFDFLKACLIAFERGEKHLFDKIPETNIFTENHFEYFVDNELHNGSIDLLIKQDEPNYLVVDYKSDCAEFADEETFKNYLKTTYLPELSLYKEALETKYKGVNVCLKIIYFRHYSTSKTIEVKELDL